MRRISFKLSSLPYFEKWFIMGLIIGIISGLGATIFYFSIRFFEYIFLARIVGTNLPRPLGENGSLIYHFYALRFYLIPVVLIAGAAISSFIVQRFAPEAEGHGTDSAIRSFHYNYGKIRRRIPVVKTIASAITIGSGGSAGREGPTAQIAAGLGSFIADLLGLTPRDRRIAVAVGIGSGIGTIFKAPIGGAVLGAEILYRRDMETEVLFPSIVAASVGYSIFASIVGFEPIFGYYLLPFNPLRLPFYATLGLITGLFAIFYVRFFYGTRDFFKRLNLSPYYKPIIGAAFTGIIALFFPEVLSTGYGWVQLLEYGRFNEFVYYGMPLVIFLVFLPFMKVFATSFTVASGGSGGVFAPGIFIGASLGALLGYLVHLGFPYIAPNIAPFVIIGMLSFFGAAGKVPLSVILMVVEMTGSLQLLPGAMLAVAISYIVSGTKYSIYESQVLTRRDSPANMGEFSSPLLKNIIIKDLNIEKIYVEPYDEIYSARELMNYYELYSLPVVQNQKFLGTVYVTDLENARYGPVNDYYVPATSFIRPESNAEAAWELMMKNRTTWCPVVKDGNFIGIVRLKTILDVYKKYLEENPEINKDY
ncbi:chloride channel protein [Picrophilus oshimae]|uniref:Chloride channel protein, CIC family n=1 Tax=Picrophilus torridus (strain ATCC 700027 / DSM 9790 / JCM 10055 / NBRC 100828 / KAW 2/3) TaxID=1122961 RepID=A0A8G2FXR3_PICTO|nr:chloride channel protein [Picrophilus oshimae]SMD31368.1 chloride channel protein, CIC family [Picrophilus oshimae DSM 9789]